MILQQEQAIIFLKRSPWVVRIFNFTKMIKFFHIYLMVSQRIFGIWVKLLINNVILDKDNKNFLTNICAS